MSRITIISVITLSSVIGSAAFGQEPPRKGASRDQHYEFDDDPLEGVGLDQRGERIRVRRDASRVTLIRPRTHFIVELTRSVENL